MELEDQNAPELGDNRPLRARTPTGAWVVPPGGERVSTAPPAPATPETPQVQPEPPARAISAPPERGPSGGPPDSWDPTPDKTGPPDDWSGLEKAHDAVKGFDPAEARRVFKVSEALGADPASVASDLSGAEKSLSYPTGTQLRDLERDFPRTASWLMAPRNMAASQDDIENLRAHEGIFSGLAQSFQTTRHLFEAGSLKEEKGFLLSRRLPGGGSGNVMDYLRPGYYYANALGAASTPEERVALINARLHELEQIKEPETWLKKNLKGAIEFLPQMGGAGAYGAATGTAAAGAAAAATAWAGPGAALPAVGAGGIGFKAGEALYFYRLMGGMALEELDNAKDVNGNGLPDSVKVPVAMAMGAAQAGLSFVPFAELLKTTGAGQAFLNYIGQNVAKKALENPLTYRTALQSVAKQYLESVAHGTGAMVGITGIGTAGREYAKAVSGQPFVPPTAEGIGGELKEGLSSGLGTMGFLALPGSIVTAGQATLAARRAELTRKAYDAMGSTAEASKLREQLPTAYQDFVEHATKDGPVENLYSPIDRFDTYFQSKGIDPVAVAKELGISESYAEAKARGGDVKIPTATWATKIVGTEHFQGLADDVKFQADDYTPREIEEHRAEFKKLMDEQAKKAAGEKPGEAPPEEELPGTKRVRELVSQELKAMGLSKAEIEADPAAHAQVITNLAKKMRVDPLELHTRFPFLVQWGAPGEGGGRTMEQRAPAEFPAISHESQLGDFKSQTGMFDPKFAVKEGGQTVYRVGSFLFRPEPDGKISRVTRGPNGRFMEAMPRRIPLSELPAWLAKNDRMGSVAKALGIEPRQYEQKALVPTVQNQPTTQKRQTELGFYSQLERSVDGMDFKEAPAKDLLGRIKNLPGIKAEELEQLGLEDWLKARHAETAPDSKVSKAELLNFIRQGGVKVEQTVLAKDFEGQGGSSDTRAGDLEWSEPEIQPPSDDWISSEAEYYLENGEDYFGDDWKEKKTEIEKGLAEDHADKVTKDEDGNVTAWEFTGTEEEKAAKEEKFDAAVNDNLVDAFSERAHTLADESYRHDEGGTAEYKVTESNTGWDLIGNNEYGWYSPELQRTFETTLEEAQVRLTQAMIQRGEIEGSLGDLIKPSDINWGRHEAMVEGRRLIKGSSESEYVEKQAKKLLRSKAGKEIRQAARDKEKNLYRWKDDPKEVKKELESGYLEEAKRRVLDAMADPTNPENTVRLPFNAQSLDGSIRGNDAKGYTLHVGGQGPMVGRSRTELKVPLEGAKNLGEAKRMALAAMQERSLIGKEETEAQPGERGVDVNKPTGRSQYDRYTMPEQKTNYREFLIRLPDVKPSFTGAHHSGKNIVAHTRVADLQTERGGKALGVKEVQSDWAQKGRERGFVGEKEPEDRTQPPPGWTLKRELDGTIIVHNEADLKRVAYPKEAEADAIREAWSQYDQSARYRDRTRIPDAPFVKSTEAWASLVMKRMLRVAVEQGYDSLAWLPSEPHIETWGTDTVSWKKVEKPGFEVIREDGSGLPGPIFDSKAKANEWIKEKRGEDGILTRGKKYSVVELPAEGFLVGATEQSGGNAGGVDIEGEARRRNMLLERNGERITTKEELRQVLQTTLGRERNDRSLDSLTEQIWKEMQANPEGHKEPRAEGMKFFYDNLLPRKVLPAILKKLDKDAKVTVDKIEGTGQQVWSVPLTDAIKKKVMEEGLPLFQKPTEGEGAKAQITFQPTAEGFRAIVNLFKTADKSSLLHETGHYWLELVSHLANSADAPDSIKALNSDIRKWLGAKDGEALTTEQHEKWARAYEAYLREGNAPTPALASAFRRFSEWLTSIYRNVKEQLGIELDPEIRDIFDRLMASEEEVDAARQRIGYTGEPMEGVAPEVQARIGALQAEARRQAQSELIREQMKELRDKSAPEIEAERKRLTQEAKDEVSTLPLYVAMNELGTTKKVVEMANAFLDNRVTEKVEAQFEAQAELNGFASGEELAKAILADDARDGFNTEVKQRVDAGMAKFEPLRDPNQLRLLAMKAIHDTRMTELLALEHEVLRGLVNEAGTQNEVNRRNRMDAASLARETKDQAKKILAGKPIKEASNPGVYLTAERRAAVDGQKALAKGDKEAALEAKRRQMMNHALASEAMRNAKESTALEKKFDAIRKTNLLETMPYAFSRQVNELMARYGLADRRVEATETLTEIAKKMDAEGKDPGAIANATGLVKDGADWRGETLSEFVDRVNDDYTGVSLPPVALASIEKPYRALTMSELRDLHDAVSDIIHVGKQFDRFFEAFNGADIKASAQEAANRVRETFGNRYGDRRGAGSAHSTALKEKASDALKGMDRAIPELVNMYTLCRALDGGAAEGGPMMEGVFRPISEALNRKMARFEKAVEAMSHVFTEAGFTPKELSAYRGKRYMVEEIGRYMTKEELLFLGMNWGNEGNRDRVREGYGLNDTQVEQILDRYLEKRDWKLIQGTIDYLHTYWPDVVRLEMDVKGIEPRAVEPSTIKTKWGEEAGGYFPIAYDPKKSEGAYTNDQQRNALYKQNPATRAMTDRGHAEARVSSVKNRPLNLSFNVLFNHLDNVIHDLEFRRSVIDVSRFLRQPELRSALIDAIGLDGVRSFDEWLKAVASDQGEALSPWERRAKWFRFNTTIATIGARLVIVPLKLGADSISAMRELTPIGFAKASADYLMNRDSSKEFILARSERMKHRATLVDRDLRDMSNRWTSGMGPIRQFIGQYAFWAEYFADGAVSFPMWKAVYDRNVAMHGDQKARAIADEAVDFRLGSANSLMRVGAQRGSEWKKLTSMFYTFHSSLFNQAWLDGKIAGMEYRKENYGKAAMVIAKAVTYGWLLPAIHENLWREWLRNSPDNQDDDAIESFKKSAVGAISFGALSEDEHTRQRIMHRTLALPFGTIWLLRDIAAYTISQAQGHGRDLHMSPTEDALQTVLKPLGHAFQRATDDGKEFDQAFMEEAAKGASTLLSTPHTLDAMVFNYLDYLDGQGELTWRDLVGRRTKK